jgi:hypothetical protein
VEPIRRTLSRIVDSASIDKMLGVFGRDTMTPTEVQESQQHLARMQMGAEEQQAACDHCACIMQSLKKVGPISRKANASREEVAQRNRQSNEKSALLRQYNQHVKDPAFASQHETLVQRRFWEAWMDRASNIQASYELRDRQRRDGQALLLSTARSRHPHPPRLCSDVTEPSIFPSLDRIDMTWLREHEPPRVKDYVVLRAQEQNDAFFLGVVTAIVAPSREAQQRQLESRRDHKIRCLQRTTAPGIERIAMPDVPQRLRALYLADPESLDERMLRLMKELRSVEIQQRHQQIDARKGPQPWPVDATAPCFEIRASLWASSGVQQPTSLGLFATRDIASGEFIDWYCAHTTVKDHFLQNPTLSRSHVCALPNSLFVMDGHPTASVLTRFVADSEDSLARVRLMPPSAFEPRAMYAHSALYRPEIGTLLARYRELPKGCLVNSAGRARERVNCARKMHSGFRKKLHFDGIPFIAAVRDIRKGEELLCDYKNSEETSDQWRPFCAAAATECAAPQVSD